jgi:LPXTG-motif cell wall-anchored protein
VDTEPDTGASIVGPVLLGAGLIGGASGLTIFFRKKKKMG